MAGAGTHDVSALALARPGARTYGVFFALCIGLPCALTALSIASGDTASGRLVQGSVPLTLATVFGVCLMFSVGFALLTRRHRMTLVGNTLEVVSTFYRRRLALADLDVERARVVDLAERTELRPLIKTNAVAMPGFRSGTFRLRDHSKAFVATAGGTRVLWIPTANGEVLLLEPEQPQRALDVLRRLIRSAAR